MVSERARVMFFDVCPYFAMKYGDVFVRVWPEAGSELAKISRFNDLLNNAGIKFEMLCVEMMYRLPDWVGAPIPQRGNWRFTINEIQRHKLCKLFDPDYLPAVSPEVVAEAKKIAADANADITDRITTLVAKALLDA